MKKAAMILMVASILSNIPGWADDQQESAAKPAPHERFPSRVLSTRKTLTWLTDYQAALKQAKQENKPLYLFFTGSDWCTWCNKMEKEVLEQGSFTSVAVDQFVFLKVDLPRRAPLSPELKEQNSALASKYHVKSFPSVVILDTDETVLFKGSGAPRLEPGRYAQDLVELVKLKTQPSS